MTDFHTEISKYEALLKEPRSSINHYLPAEYDKNVFGFRQVIALVVPFTIVVVGIPLYLWRGEYLNAELYATLTATSETDVLSPLMTYGPIALGAAAIWTVSYFIWRTSTVVRRRNKHWNAATSKRKEYIDAEVAARGIDLSIIASKRRKIRTEIGSLQVDLHRIEKAGLA